MAQNSGLLAAGSVGGVRDTLSGELIGRLGGGGLHAASQRGLSGLVHLKAGAQPLYSALGFRHPYLVAWTDRLPGVFQGLAGLGVEESDSDDLRLDKAMLTLVTCLIAVMSFAWIGIYLAIGLPRSAAIPAVYQVCVVVTLVVFARTKRIGLIRPVLLVLMVVLPFVLQWSLGGFENGSAVAAWAGHWKLRTVESDSMGAALPRNSLAIVAPTNPRGRDVGDVIAFANPNDRRITTVHRVTERVEQGDAIFYRTQGDANRSSDPMLVPTSDVRGLVRGHVPRIGAAVKNLKPPWTYLALVGIPAALVTRDEVRARRQRRRQP